MAASPTSSLGRFRWVSLAEGLSYAVLVFVAMPLKYGFDRPELVRVVGMIHGGLFVVFAAAWVAALRERGWSLRHAGALFAASLVPLGALWIEGQCAAELRASASAADTQPG